MKAKRILLAAAALLLIPMLALAADFGTATVTAKTSKRVNLRESATVDSRSMGLYYVGTQVQCLSNTEQEWVYVAIGTQCGYMKSEYLDFRGGGVSRQPLAVVENGSRSVNLRREPSASSAIDGSLRTGETVTVLGETDTGWSYVDTGTGRGYVKSSFLTVGEPAPSAATPSEAGRTRPPQDTPSGAYSIKTYAPAPGVSIQYPEFADEGLNAIILGKVERIWKDIVEGATLHYQCAVTLANSRMVSVVFWGDANVEGSIHGTNDLHTLNVDLSAGREVTLSELYRTDAAFEETFLSKAYFPTDPVTSYDAERFPEMLLLQTPEYQLVSAFEIDAVECFLKPDGIVLSMPAIHATGCDHFEAQIDYADIQDWYIGREAYWL